MFLFGGVKQGVKNEQNHNRSAAHRYAEPGSDPVRYNYGVHLIPVCRLAPHAGKRMDYYNLMIRLT